MCLKKLRFLLSSRVVPVVLHYYIWYFWIVITDKQHFNNASLQGGAIFTYFIYCLVV